ncbi:ATP-dependent endonuclease [Pelagibius sp. CAU 1746]|uniref:ATP-dependent nuclease n=1 Tax=Pelagibius sp. CAU 1746 TaxID=3140370 RepID=UPI00325BB7CA
MHLSNVRFHNYRRLMDTKIDFDKDISIFVGANNSGKTSVAQAIHSFLSGSRDRFSFHDISASLWAEIEAFARGENDAALPWMAIDLWFSVDDDDLHRVIDLLPSLDWQGGRVGLRISFESQRPQETLERFREKQRLSQEAAAAAENAAGAEHQDEFVAFPRNLTEYLQKEIKREYGFKYFVLDPAQFDEELEPRADYAPLELLREQGRTGKDIVDSLIKADTLHAQRHLSDSEGGSRSEELSKHLGRYYSRNLERHADDFNAIRALSESQRLLDSHLEQVFAGTLSHLAELGYPGLTNPRLVIRSALNPATVMSSHDGTQVHYALDDGDLTLPDKYSGLGFKNLVYMVVQLLDYHAQWIDTEKNRPPVHLVFVEEPEAHLHAQLQQVFVNKILGILAEESDGIASFTTQLALTTHSPHILYERGFRPIRYFRRENSGLTQRSRVLNLSEFYERTANPSRDFLERYLKLTHCDLFFADAAILVEGNVERLLMPQFILNSAPGLRSTYLSVLEVGGAFAHRFRTLIEFLGITTLIITDLDSVYGAGPGEEADANSGETGNHKSGNEEEIEGAKPGRTCRPEEPNAVTSNRMLIDWLPAREQIDQLLALGPEAKTQYQDGEHSFGVRVTYPLTVQLELDNNISDRAGRTFEEAFAFENLAWTQIEVNADLGLRIPNVNDVEGVGERLHKRIHRSSFKKTDFALALLAKGPVDWKVPSYILEGLLWLEKELGVAITDKEGGEDQAA